MKIEIRARGGGKTMKLRPICPACGSKVCYYRQKTKDFICRRCGHIGKRDKFMKGR